MRPPRARCRGSRAARHAAGGRRRRRFGPTGEPVTLGLDRQGLGRLRLAGARDLDRGLHGGAGPGRQGKPAEPRARLPQPGDQLLPTPRVRQGAGRPRGIAQARARQRGLDRDAGRGLRAAGTLRQGDRRFRQGHANRCQGSHRPMSTARIAAASGRTSTAPSPTPTRRSRSIPRTPAPMRPSAMSIPTATSSTGRSRAFDTAIGFVGNRADLYVSRGNVQLFRGRLDEAFGDYDKAASLDPQSVDAFNGRGVVENYRGEHDAAIADFNKAIELTPTMSMIYVNRGELLLDMGRRAEATPGPRQGDRPRQRDDLDDGQDRSRTASTHCSTAPMPRSSRAISTAASPMPTRRWPSTRAARRRSTREGSPMPERRTSLGRSPTCRRASRSAATSRRSIATARRPTRRPGATSSRRGLRGRAAARARSRHRQGRASSARARR